MISEHMAWKGLRNRLDDHGVPLAIAMQMAGACYPLGASREARLSGFISARSVISSYEAREIVEKLLAVPESHTQRLLIPLLDEMFGRQQVERWLDESTPEREPEDQITAEKEHQQALVTEAGDANPERGLVEEEKDKTEDEKPTGGGIIVPSPRTLEPPDGPISFPDPPVTPRTTWYLLATASVLSVLAIGVALSLPRTQIPKQPGLQAPLPTALSPAELKLKKAITSARELLSKKRYQSAVEALSSFLPKPPGQPDDIKDKRLWAEYLKVFADSRTKQYRARQGTRTDQEMHDHLPKMHDIGLAWHFLMLDALAEGKDQIALESFREAERHYQDVQSALQPTGEWMNVPEWRLKVCGWATENRGTIRSQLASANGDERLMNEAYEFLENSRLFYAKSHGTNSKEYRRVYEELAKLGDRPRDK